ncbi:hypothetical protein [Shewanella sedimentimangrovi]|uniref:Uncharacterized protein n=1 Tax=Shewanella sedimentimangrovi TaxID=2814293 RepID=A0ABX7R2V5_9GAMM|nr:hypothetical protein [Shewanella sedimentimangrovi]QSX37160.1 hypothetical protein JYB85_18255 [Shewanella sedimentimangrovi]
MLLVSHYPQVPLATSNAATDAARVDSQLRPPIIPPSETTKGHEERAFNPQHERTADEPQIQSRLQQRVEERQQQHQGSQQEQQQRQAGEQQQNRQAPPRSLKIPAKQHAALSRKDIKVRSETRSPQPKANQGTSPQAGMPEQFYRAIAAHVSEFYAGRTAPEEEPALSAWI